MTPEEVEARVKAHEGQLAEHGAYIGQCQERLTQHEAKLAALSASESQEPVATVKRVWTKAVVPSLPTVGKVTGIAGVGFLGALLALWLGIFQPTPAPVPPNPPNPPGPVPPVAPQDLPGAPISMGSGPHCAEIGLRLPPRLPNSRRSSSLSSTRSR